LKFYRKKGDLIIEIYTMTQPHDSWAPYYDYVYERTFGSFYHDLTRDTIGIIKEILPEGEIIDFGAGTGRLSLPLAEQGYSVVAVEKSSAMVEEFKRKAGICHLKVPMHHTSISQFGENIKADLALALFTVLTYSITRDELSDNIRNICCHINPNGKFFFDLPNPIFFHAGRLTNIQSGNFSRKVELTGNHETDVYTYREICSGTSNGKEFKYEDEFCIRYWSPDVVDALLTEHGFFDTGRIFPQFNSTGSTYKLYQRK
jgi:2-polyprenyl-3-methyl-5-hydroxy-6-metoxy-1,4-benzoquinol methylase